MKIENADNGKSTFCFDYELDFNVSERIKDTDPIKPRVFSTKDIQNEVIKRFNVHEQLVEAIARNLVAWDTSKDKKQGLLPEIYLTNRVLYRELTGEEYEFSRACEKFCIGDDWS